jgi:hypothetical protein
MKWEACDKKVEPLQSQHPERRSLIRDYDNNNNGNATNCWNLLYNVLDIRTTKSNSQQFYERILDIRNRKFLTPQALFL